MSMDPNNNLGYWLFYTQRSVAYAFAEVMKQCCLEHGKPYVITPPQWGALALLQEQDGITIGTFSRLRRVDAPTVTGIITRLEQHGLVERRHDREDRRVVKVFLTEEGRRAIAMLSDSIAAFDAVMTQGFTEGELRDFLFKLKSIAANVASALPAMNERYQLSPDDFVDTPSNAAEEREQAHEQR